MVKTDELPTEQGRIPLDKLSNFMDAHSNRIILIVTEQKMVAENKEAKKTGGLKANLWTGKNFKSKYDITTNQQVSTSVLYEDGLQVTQKWGKIPSASIVNTLEELGFKDTDVLSEKFFEYKLQDQRSGFSRLLPIKVSDKKPEQLS